jgi:hypothetical protein
MGIPVRRMTAKSGDFGGGRKNIKISCTTPEKNKNILYHP